MTDAQLKEKILRLWAKGFTSSGIVRRIIDDHRRAGGKDLDQRKLEQFVEDTLRPVSAN